MEEPLILSPLEHLLLNYRELASDQELLEDLDYVTLMNLCRSNTRLREICQESDIQALLKKKERESAFIILGNLTFIEDDVFSVDMIIHYPKLLQINLSQLKFEVGPPTAVGGNTINSDIESLVNGEPFRFRRGVTNLGNYDAEYFPEQDIVQWKLRWSSLRRTRESWNFSAPLYHRILITILELYDLEYAIALEGGEMGLQEIYIHV